MSITKIFLLLMLTLIIMLPVASEGAWFETHNLGLGDYSMNATGANDFGLFTQIPESPYILFSSGNSMIIIEVPTGKLRDGLMSHHTFSNRIVIPDTESGWNLFYTYNERFGSLHINSHGEFGEDKWLENYYEISTNGVGVPQRNEIWYFYSRIYHLDTITEEWTAYNYPIGWDPDFKYVNLFPTEDLNTLIAVSRIENQLSFQAMWFNLEKGESKLIISEPDFFKGVIDIKECKSKPGYYLILKKEEIWSYNIIDGVIEKIMHGFDCHSQNIMQDKTGAYLYMFGGGSSLYILDLINETVANHLLPLHEGDKIAFSGQSDMIFDSLRNKLIIFISNDSTNSFTLGIIDLADITLQYIERIPKHVGLEVSFLQRENRILAKGLPFIYIVDIDTKEVDITTSLVSQSSTWSAAWHDPSPTIIPEKWSMYFKRIQDLGAKKLNYAGTGNYLSDVVLYPVSNRALMKISTDLNVYKYKEYNFYDDSFEDIELPGETSWIDIDPINKQLITFKMYENAIVQFIKPHGKVRSWVPPDIENLNGFFRYFDPEHNEFWAIYLNKQNSDRQFYKISTTMYDLVDSFTLSKDDISYPSQMKIDPTNKFLYLIDSQKLDKLSTRILVIFDLEKKEIIKRIFLQLNVGEATIMIGNRVIPGIIPIPGHDKVFIWDHYGSWCIDTNTWEVLYGEIVSDPKAQTSRINFVDGYWDEERKVIVVVDNSYEVGCGFLGWRILEADLETGKVIRQIATPEDDIAKVFFPQDKIKIFMLSNGKPRYFVFNLTPVWENPATIETSTNFLQYTPGDNCKMSIKVRNGENEQNIRVYIWLCLPTGSYLFFNGMTFVPEVTGISILLPANIIDFEVDLVTFIIPEIMPEGFYNFNAIFVNEKYEFGPMGTWNFYIGD
ncbi:hypothetical protein KKB18_03810 [bacterium]|nr:hypothetical protein [bacterium]